MPPTRLDPSLFEGLANRINAGERVAHVAREVGYSAPGLRDLLRSRGFTVNTTGWNKLSAQIVDAAIRRIAAGEAVKTVAKELGVTHSVLNGHFRRRTGGFVGRHKRTTALTIPEEPTVLAYIAGLFDGEGTIVKHANSGGWRLAIYNTHQDALDYMAEHLGRSYVTTRRGRVTDLGYLRKPCHQFCLYNMLDVYLFLSALLPYLRIRHEKAASVIADLRFRLKLKEGNPVLQNAIKITG